MRKRNSVAVVVSLVASLLLLTGATLAQDVPEPAFFEETGHSVQGDFLSFFRDHGGLAVLGYPVTEQFFDQRSDRVVQFFQNGRLEVDPIDGRVRLGALSRELLQEKRQPAIDPAEVKPGAEYFAPTGHSVMLAFLDFFWRYGGPEVFGYPVSELVLEDGRPVQYFERAILEWWPELPDGQRVQLSRWGLVEFHLGRYDPGLLSPIARAQTITDLKVTAAVHRPIIQRQGGEQTISVFVRDQLGQAAAGAQVQAIVHLPNREQVLPAAMTGSDGTAIIRFAVPLLEAGVTVPIQVTVSHSPQVKETATAFRVWW